MTDTTPRPVNEKRLSSDAAAARQGPKDKIRSPESRGRTTIADSVVEKIAGVATREVPGIHNIGTGLARTIGGVRERMTGEQPSITRGVNVEVGEQQAAVDLDVVIDYGFPITNVTADVRTNVISTLEHLTGLEIVEVNITVDDIDVPGEDTEGDEHEHRVE